MLKSVRVGGLTFLLLGLPMLSVSFADVQKWDFENPDDYRFDSEKLQVEGKTAALKKRQAIKDEGQAQFDLGQGDRTWAAQGRLELIPQTDEPLIAPSTPLPVDPRTPGLLALWHLDEPSGTNLLDGMTHTVAKSNEAEIVSGQSGFGYARLFNGTQSHIFIPNYDTFQWKGPLTFETWVRPLSATPGRVQTLISRWQTLGGQKSFGLEINASGKINFKVSPNGSTAVQVSGETVLSPGRWYHVSGVFTGTEIRVYVNGILDGIPVPFAGPVYATVTPIYLGALADGKMANFLEGVLDEVAFYSSALTDAQLAGHYGNPQAVVGYWKFDERAGLFEDASGYGHAGVAQGEVEYAVEGRRGAALQLNGKKQFVEVASSIHVAPEDALTLELWIKPSQLPSGGQFVPLVASTEGESEYALGLQGPDGRLTFRAPLLSPSEFSTPTSMNPNVWNHVAVSLAAGRLQLFVNGILEQSSVYSGFLKMGVSGLRIGTDRAQAAYYSGAVDELALFRRAKNASEIAVSMGGVPNAGTYVSQAKDAGSQSPWQSMTWKTAGNYGMPVSKDAEGILHLYPLDDPEDAAILDEKNEIPLNAMGTASVSGVFGRARWFSKRGYDKLLSQQAFPSLSTYTISLWAIFRHAEPQGIDRLFSIGDENPSVFRSAPDGKIHVVAQGMRKMVSTKTIRDSEWHHVALSSDGHQLFLFIDGQNAGSAPFTQASAAEPLVLGNLKTTDFFEGGLDDFALFNYGMSADAIQKLFLSKKLDAKILVRTSESKTFESAPWRGPRGPQGVELRPTASTVALWHFNEPVLGGKVAASADESRYANHAVAVGSEMASPRGALGFGIELNGSSDFLTVPDAPSFRIRDKLTLAAWVRPSAIEQQGARILDKQYRGGSPIFSSFSLELAVGNRLALRLGHDGGFHMETTDQEGEIPAEQWSHVAATYDGKEIRLYINGKLKKTALFRQPLIYDQGPLFIGRYGSGNAGFFHGGLDEILVAQEALDETTLATLFLNADPENVYRGGSAMKLETAPGQYFQYRVQLESDIPSLSPVIESISVQGAEFSVDRPAISNAVSVSYADISSIRQITGPLHKGAITYQLSNDGSNWFYHNGRHWVLASSVTESNTMNQVSQRIREFPKDVGIGSFYFKAFFHSLTGVEPVELEGIELEFLPNKLTQVAPNGGEAWLVGSDQEIRWNTAGEVATVRLEYSRDNFQKDFQVIAKEVPNQGVYRWKVPDTVSPSVKIRVMDSLDPRIYDTSDLSFRMTGAFEIVSPNYDERWEVNTKQKITWRALGTIQEVKLEYSPDNFEKEIFSIIDSTKNEGEYHWTLPNQISQTMRVRISDVRDPKTQDISNDVFTIHGRLKFISPEAGARWRVGTSQEIRWKTTGIIPGVRIEYSLEKDDGSRDWLLLEKEWLNRNAYVWQIPDSISSKIKIRITDPRDGKVADESSDFSIVGGVEVLNPQGLETWTVGSKRKIAWKATGAVQQVNLDYASLSATAQQALKDGKFPLQSKDVTWKPIEKNVTNIGSYVWTIPDHLSGSVVIRVSDARDGEVGAFTKNTFRIVPGFVLHVPNGGEGWVIGSDQTIEWETHGTIETVKLEYSKDDFVKDSHTIIEQASNLGRFIWTIPDDAGARVWVRISDPGMPEASDISDVPFRIFGSFRVTAPLGGEKFESGSLGKIGWETLGSIPNVKIEYSRDDFQKDVRTIADSVPNQGAYTWSIPDDIGSGLKLRITDVRDPQASSLSEGFFSIVGKFHLVNPVGGENLVAGSLLKIDWKGAGSIPFVRLDYSEDDFTKSFITIAEAAPNSGSFNWMIPNLTGKSLKLRIWDPSHPESVYVMDAAFRIVGGFTLTSPNGGEILYVGEPFDLSWETYGNVERIKIELSGDHFQKKIWEVADSGENVGHYRWELPDVPAGLYQLKISDAQDPVAFDLSNSDFRIRSRFKLLSPSGGEGWSVGEKHTLRWQTSGSVARVRLEYSTDDFKSSVTIAEAAPNTGSYEWVVPERVSQTLKIRVSDAEDAGAMAVTDSNLKTQALINLVSPKGGEIWRVGHSYPILWQTTGEVKAVRIEFSRDGFISEAKVIVPTLENKGAFDWTVPDEISRHMKVRVLDLANTSAQAVSPQEFQVAGSFQILTPNGGEVWHALEKREITWITVGTVPEVDLTFCVVTEDPKAPCIPDSALNEARFILDKNVSNQGRYVWDLPRVVGERFRLKVCDSENPEICDLSDKSFAISTPFEVVYPRGGDLWPIGSEQEIRWQTFGNVARVLVQYANAENLDPKNPKALIWKTLAEGVDNQGRLLLKVPDEASTHILFKVADWDDEELYTLTQNPVQFTGTFSLERPVGGEKWAAGSTQKIVWDTKGTIPNVRIEYSTDQFVHDVNPVESSIGNLGSYDWTLPAVLSPMAKIRISDAANPKAFAISPAVFKMMAGFVLLRPDGGEVWKVGSRQKIQWKTVGRVDKVELQYQTVGEWKKIASQLANGGEFEWQVPNDVSLKSQIRVLDQSDLDAWDASNESFEIRSDLVVASPNGGEKFTVGMPGEIRWVSIGNVGTLRLEYSKDGFEKDLQLIAQNVPDGAPYVWTPGDDVTDKARVRVVSELNEKVLDSSDLPFKILPAIRVLSPKPGMILTVDSRHTVEWDWRGTLDAVHIEMSSNDFRNSVLLAKDVVNTGRWSWKVPDEIHSKLKIRISDSKHPDAFGVMEHAFKITPGFALTSPNGGELWKAGEKASIRWDTYGTSPKVVLQYAFFGENQKPEWKTLGKPLANHGEFLWQIPEEVSSRVKLRVLDAQDRGAGDASDETFKILSVFRLESPVRSQVHLVGDALPVMWQTRGRAAQVKIEFSPLDRADGEPEQFFPVASSVDNSGKYVWTVPDAIGDSVRLKISNMAEPDSFLVSEPFAVRGKIFGKITEGQSNWQVGTTQTIFWKTVGNIAQMDLAYKLPDSMTWKGIAQGIPNTGSYGWLIPDDVALGVTLRVSDSLHPEIFDEIDSKIAIAARFEFLTPRADERLTVGAAQDIQWTTAGKVARTYLEYSLSGGAWISLAGPIPNAGICRWKIPDAISSEVRIRVRDGDNDAAFTVSSPFAIRGALELTAPGQAEVWKVDSKQEVTWKTLGTIPQVKLELIAPASQEGGEVATLIKESLPNQGRFEWTLPDRIADDLKIRISDTRDSAVVSESIQPFSIVGSFSMVSPKGGEVWTVGQEEQIVWVSRGSVSAVNVEYSRDNFMKDVTLFASNLPNTGMTVWKIPDAVSNSMKIRVVDAQDPRSSGTSPGTFKIQGSMAVTAPGLEEVWTVGETKAVTWATVGTLSKVRLEYSRDEFNKDIQIIQNAAENTGRFEWKVPDVISSSLRFRIRNAEDVSVFAVSNPVKVQGRIRLVSLQKSEVLRVMSRKLIRWETTGSIPKVRIETSRDNFHNDIRILALGIPNTGAWEWQVPDTIGAGLKLRVLDEFNFKVGDVTPEALEIQGALLLAESGHPERLAVGAKKEILWNTIGTIPEVRLEYSKEDTFQAPVLIAEHIKNSGSYFWNIPDDITDNLWIRISDVRTPEVSARSENPMAIVGTLRFLEPPAGAVFQVGSSQMLRWSTVGTIPEVRLEYSISVPEATLAGKDVWNLITGAIENGNSYAWQIPNDISNNVRIRISDAKDPSVTSISEGFYQIRGSLQMLEPRGKERWIAGTTHELTWASLGAISKVRLEYSRDSFSKEIVPIEESIANTGHYAWTVPDALSDHVQVRVISVEDPRVMAISPQSFSIIGDFIFIEQDEAAVWNVGSEQKIEWQTIGTVPQVKLEFAMAVKDAKDPLEFQVIQSGMINQGRYVWKVADRIGEGAIFRISDVRDAGTTVVSNRPVKITGAFRVLSPSKKDSWLVGDVKKIEWETQGSVSRVNLSVSSDGFQEKVFEIEKARPNENGYFWQVPDLPGADIQIRVQDADDPTVFKTSAPFKIRGALKMLTPAGSGIFKVGETRRLQWQTVGTIPTVILESSLDRFVKHTQLIRTVSPNDGKMDWKVPDEAAKEVWIRVRSAEDANTFSMLPSPVQIQPDLKLIHPQGAEVLKVGSRQTIQWTSSGKLPWVRIEYSNDGFQRNRQMLAEKALNQGSFEWVVSDFIYPKVDFRISSPEDAALVSQTAQPVKIEGVLDFLSLSKDETWQVSDKKVLEWTSKGSIPQVRIEYSSDEFRQDVHVIYEGISNQGTAQWVVPDGVKDPIRLRVSDARDPKVSSYSKGTADILGVIHLLTPRGGEALWVAQETLIQWKSQGDIPKVSVEYSLDGFQYDIRPIAKLMENEGKLFWKVPDAISENVQIRVMDPVRRNVQAISSAFHIRGQIEIIRPSSSNVFRVGAEESIQWRTIGTVRQFTLEYSLDRFERDVRMINRAFESTGTDPATYVWQIPDAISDHVWLRVSDAQNPKVAALSDRPFKIQGSFVLLAPKGGEVLSVGGRTSLTWKTLGTLAKVNLEYSRDGFRADRQPLISGLQNQGFFEWEVPDMIAERVWVRVASSEDPSVFATHADPLKIQGRLEMTAPEGGKVWAVGSSQLIQWKSLGSIPEVRLEYRTPFAKMESAVSPVSKERSEWFVIQDRLPNRGNYLWQISGDLPPELRLRVVDPSNTTVFAEAAGSIKIRPTLRILSPNKRELWRVGTKQEIVWESRGYLPQVKVEYSRDGFRRDMHLISPLLNNSGHLTWQVPAEVASEMTFRVSDPEDLSIHAVSEFPVEIIGGLRLDSPKGGERVVVGSDQEITWTTEGNISMINLEYSHDGFLRHRQPIADRIANIGRYLWKVPDDMGPRVWVRVSDSQNPDVMAASQEPFAIMGGLFLKRPGAREIWAVGSTQSIEWETVGTIPNLKLEYSTDEFLTATAITEIVRNEGTYRWKVPDVVSNQLRIRISDAQDDDVYSVSAAPVKVQGVLEILNPREGDFWVTGSQKIISWRTQGSVPYVTLEFSGDHFAHASPIILGLANSGSYNWTVPDLLGSDLQIRITNSQDAAVSAVSPLFHIGGTLALLTPSGGETWRVGETQDIRWKTTGSIKKVKLEISTDQFHQDIQVLTGQAENTGVYSWKVPDWIRPALQVRVSDANNPAISTVSAGPLKISGSLELVRPQGGEIWKVGSRQEIAWKTVGTIPAVRMEYSTDHFSSVMPIEMETPNLGTYDWQIPDLVGAEVRIRVSDIRDPSIFSDMNYSAMIQGALKMIQPAGGEVWPVASEQMITWQTTGSISNINLEYSEDDFITAKPIAMAIGNRGSFLWKIPALNTTNLRIRVMDSATPQIYDMTAQPSKILGQISLLAPQGGETLVVGRDFVIRWNAVGRTDRVRIEYTTDRFRSAMPVVNEAPNSGEYVWKVPDALSKQVMLRVTDAAQAAIFGETKTPFEIRGALSFQGPVGGEVWSLSNRYPISWVTLGTIPQVRLEISRDDFRRDVQVLVSNLANKGLYTWELPMTAGGDVKFRIVDSANPDIFDVTRAPVHIAGKLDLSFPTWSETFQVGERIDIQWKSSPNIGTVKIETSLDDFGTVQVISASAPNSGRFSWNVPDQITDRMKLRISDAQDSSVFSISPNPFRIRGALKLLTPIGGEVWPVGSLQKITWATGGSVPEVRLEYSTDDFSTVMPIVSKTSNTGLYEWKIPEISERDIRIRVSYLGDTAVSSQSLGSIRILGQIKMVVPNGGERWIAGEQREIRWQTSGSVSRVTLEYSKDDFQKDIHLMAADTGNLESYFWTVPNDRSPKVWVRVRSQDDPSIDAVSRGAFAIDYYKIRWVIQDLGTQSHLNGLTLTDSSGQTQKGLTSPVTLERPYGIYTTAWSLPGYKEFKNTWVADSDRSFAVLMEKDAEALEQPRVDFEYDKSRDLVKITSWFERNGKPVPAVIQSEVRIYDGARLTETLRSSNPDASGHFQMVWNTREIPGNSRYLASASITLSNSRVISSPIGFQIDIPVKQGQPLETYRGARYGDWVDTRLEPPGEPAAPQFEKPEKNIAAELPKSKVQSKRVSGASSQIVQSEQLIAPEKAVLNETISIQYVGSVMSRPVLDLYDSNRKLVLRGIAMTSTDQQPGRFSYLMQVSGIAFVPGKPVNVTVVDLKSGHFLSKQIQIQTSADALGMSRTAGTSTILNLIQRFEQTLLELRESESDTERTPEWLSSLNRLLLDLATDLTPQDLDAAVLTKLNHCNAELARILSKRGFDAGFLSDKPLGMDSDFSAVSDKVRQLQAAVAMLERIYQAMGSLA